MKKSFQRRNICHNIRLCVDTHTRTSPFLFLRYSLFSKKLSLPSTLTAKPFGCFTWTTYSFMHKYTKRNFYFCLHYERKKNRDQLKRIRDSKSFFECSVQIITHTSKQVVSTKRLAKRESKEKRRKKNCRKIEVEEKIRRGKTQN